MASQQDQTEVPNLPSISVRDYIRWIPGLATEPTSTLVLTSAERRYIDIRIYKPTHKGEPDLPNEGTQPRLLDALYSGPMSRLEWAFAGTSSTSLTAPPPSSPHDDPTIHSVWKHWIDSRTDGPVLDEGDLFPQKDGRTLEFGQMVNPDTGRLMRYEESWRDVVVTSTEGDDRGVGVVLMLEDEEHGVKGMVVRVGGWCQGLIKIGERDGVEGEVALERWKWEDGERAKKGAWKRVARLGRLFVPCASTFEPARVVVGGKVRYGDYEWKVVENFSWPMKA